MLVSTVSGPVVAVLDAAALWVVGVPLPLPWGLLALVTDDVPGIGFVLDVVVQTVVRPKLAGDAVGPSPAPGLRSLLVRTLAVGPPGATLAVPLTLLVEALLVDSDPERAWLPPLPSDSGPAGTGAPLPAAPAAPARTAQTG